MTMSERQMRAAEDRIPALGRKAIKQAVAKARATGHSVVVSTDGNLIELHPDGSQRFLKKLPPRVPVTRGMRLIIE